MSETKLTGLESLLDDHQRQTEALLSERERLQEENALLRKLMVKAKQEQVLLAEKQVQVIRKIKALIAYLGKQLP